MVLFLPADLTIKYALTMSVALECCLYREEIASSNSVLPTH